MLKTEKAWIGDVEIADVVKGALTLANPDAVNPLCIFLVDVEGSKG
jgi:hypothetical protein